MDEAEYIKETTPIIYENEYLGLETGDGGNVFENIELREITNEEISHFDIDYIKALTGVGILTHLHIITCILIVQEEYFIFLMN